LALLHHVLVPGALRTCVPFDVSLLLFTPLPDAPQLPAGPQRSLWFGR
jgi:hypothetical protein